MVADTSAWIELFRGTGLPVVRPLKAALRKNELYTIGVVRLELVAGARSKRDLALVLRFLATTIPIETMEEDYDAAGHMVFRLRRKGITVHAVDALVASIAIRTRKPLLTVDPDFRSIADHEGLALINPDS